MNKKTDRANMKSFQVFSHPTLGYEAIKKGFSWPAMFTTVIWLFVKKLQLHAFVVLVLLTLLGIFEPAYRSAFERYAPDNYEIRGSDIILLQFFVVLSQLCISIFVGFKGNSWRVANVQEKGYQLVDTVQAARPETAIAAVSKSEPSDNAKSVAKTNLDTWGHDMKIYLIVISVIILIVLGVFVWPTQYKYEHIGGDFKVLIRIQRLTGEVEALRPEGWRRMGPSLGEPLNYDPFKK